MYKTPKSYFKMSAHQLMSYIDLLYNFRYVEVHEIEEDDRKIIIECSKRGIQRIEDGKEPKLEKDKADSMLTYFLSIDAYFLRIKKN